MTDFSVVTHSVTIQTNKGTVN